VTQNKENRRTWDSSRPLRVGGYGVALFVGIVLIWGTLTEISGAVLATGQIRVDSNKTAIQHQEGGIVAEILVSDGDSVKAGDVVVRLDDTELRSELNLVEGELFEILADSARLQAIAGEWEELQVPPLLEERQETNASVRELLERQREQLAAYYSSTEAERDSLREKINQVAQEIEGSESELTSKQEKLDFLEAELARMEEILAQGLIKKTEVQNLKKEKLDTQGAVGKLTADIAKLRGRKLEIQVELEGLEPTLKEKAGEKLNKSQRESGKFSERRNGILSELARLEVRTPISGTIHDSQVEGVRSVVLAGKPIMYVIPDDKPVAVLARVDSGDIDEVYPGQDAMLKFAAFDARAMPNIFGKVTRVSPDAFLDEKTKRSHYEVEVSLPREELEKLGDNQLISGMPVSVFLTTTSRSPVQYVLRPLTTYLDRALRDS
jgi:HlyD family secretion protein